MNAGWVIIGIVIGGLVAVLAMVIAGWLWEREGK